MRQSSTSNYDERIAAGTGLFYEIYLLRCMCAGVLTCNGWRQFWPQRAAGRTGLRFSLGAERRSRQDQDPMNYPAFGFRSAQNFHVPINFLILQRCIVDPNTRYVCHK
jgi:hypothetical protein